MEISIVITNYNYEHFLARAIRSCISQSFNKSEYEIIVIDDNSSDGSRETIKALAGHIKPIFNDTNLGLAASCNKAIRSALGKFVVRLDADDFVHKDWLLVLHMFLSYNKDMDAASSDYLDIDERENVLGRRCGTTWPIACGVMYRTDQIIALGLYNEVLPREDVEFRKRFLESKYQIYNIPIPLYRYTQHADSLTKGQINK